MGDLRDALSAQLAVKPAAASATSLLFTQCLQDDFVMPIGRYDPIPNRLHVGFSEARRLMGENPAEGPVAQVMRWAYATRDDQLRIIHLRDWHDPSDPDQQEHLRRFGQHCLRNTAGASFAFTIPDGHDKDVAVIDSLSLSDFQGTVLAPALAPYAALPLRVGIMGVWTEAKVTFLAYDLRTRYPRLELAVCSALTASSSRQHQFEALDQLQRLLGVRVCDSVGDFVAFLGGESRVAPLVASDYRSPELCGALPELADTDLALIRYLFRDCRTVSLKPLSGGFSGNVVAIATSIDLRGHEQVPHVLKIGPRAAIGKERMSFERVQDVLGNNAPQIADFADYGERGALKYRYASMGGAFSQTLQRCYLSGAPLERIQRILDTVFGEQLRRLYRAAELEEHDLLESYMFSSRWAASVRAQVENLVGTAAASAGALEILPGELVPNVCSFYEHTLDQVPRRARDRSYHAYVHGDLNGANIILDEHENVWLIDFFHTRRAHVLMDLVKLENDLLYIWTPLVDDAELLAALRLTDALMQVRDLAAELPAGGGGELPQLQRAWATVRMLRAHYPGLIHASRNPFQLWVAQLRYAVHTLSFDESSTLQKRWALYTAGRCAAKISAYLEQSADLRLDWLDTAWTRPGRIALTILPGRRDHARDLERDLEALARADVRRVLCLVTAAELERYGVPELLGAYAARGLTVRHQPIADQKTCDMEDMRAAVRWLEQGLHAGEAVLIHCVGGLGRSGTAAACLLRGRGASADEALTEVRRARSPRAVETAVQEELVRRFAAAAEQAEP